MEEKLCKCGCGGIIIIKPHHKYTGIPDYIHNHHRRGYKMTDDHKDKISEANKGRKITGEALENIQKAAKDSERNRKISESQMGDKNRMKNPDTLKKMKESLKQYYIDNPEACEIQRQNAIKQWSSQDNRDEMSRIKKQYYIDHPEENELNSQRLIQYYIDHPEACEEAREKTIEQFSDPEMRERARERSLKQWSDLETRERMSAIKQGISYDEWEDFYHADWRNWQNTLLLNDPFPGCHRHHITETLAICIPAKLHNHIRHVLKTGKNMCEMNLLAFQFMNGGL